MNPNEQAAIHKILSAIDRPVVVELGAYMGEDGPIFESMCTNGMLHIMVEPDPRNYSFIANRIDRPLNLNRVLICGAVASRPGKRLFHFSHDSRDGARGSGSIAKPTGHLAHFPTIEFRSQDWVDCLTLDQIFGMQVLDRIDLLWVDIQGAEREMIAGGTEALAKTRYCFMEAEEVELYEGQALKPELIALMPGWKLIEDFGYNILLENENFKP